MVCKYSLFSERNLLIVVFYFSSDHLRRHVQQLDSNVTSVNNSPLPGRGVNNHKECFDGISFTSARSSPLLGRDSLDSCNTSRSRISIGSALPAAADTQCSEVRHDRPLFS